MNKARQFVLMVVAIPVVIAIIPFVLVWSLVWGTVLRCWFWWAHASRGRTLLFVYSNSPNWQSYIEEHILPQIRDRAVVINWSERRNWSLSTPWEARYFYWFAGGRDSNPVALISRGLRIRPVRFHRAFLDFKHGNPEPLRSAESEVFALLEAASPLARR